MKFMQPDSLWLVYSKKALFHNTGEKLEQITIATFQY